MVKTPKSKSVNRSFWAFSPYLNHMRNFSSLTPYLPAFFLISAILLRRSMEKVSPWVST